MSAPPKKRTYDASMAVLAAVAVALLVLLHTAVAAAHSTGLPGPGCNGCHNGGDYAIALQASPSSIDPGDTVTMTLTVTSPGGAELGTFVGANEGVLATNAGQGLATVPAGLTHSAPKSMQAGVASFTFLWTAPSTPGAVRFDVSTLVANGNNSSGGDLADGAVFDFVYGCRPMTYYKDLDGDGFGHENLPLVHCSGAVPAGYSSESGDCIDSNEAIFPGAVEVCNQKDDDCNDLIDDGAIPLTLYPDADGDGFYSAEEFLSGETLEGCVPTPGYAGEPGDCAPDDPAISPGAEEVCNLIDDDCDGRVDEFVRPRCGVGWCVREAYTCDPDKCIAGDPVEEICNFIDSDCNGLVDDGAVCPAGESCISGECRPGENQPLAEESSCAFGRKRGGGWLAWLVGLLIVARRRQRSSVAHDLR